MLTLTRKTLKAVAAFSLAALALTGCSASVNSTIEKKGAQPSDKKTYTIGINQFMQHPALDRAFAGFKRALEENGLSEGQGVRYEIQNANGEQSTAQSIAQKFAATNPDLVLAIATPAAQASAQAIRNIPVLFTAVTDPVAAELVASVQQPGGNVTGTSDLASIPDQFNLLKRVVPAAKTVGIVYSSAEVNSEIQIKAAQEAASSLGLTLKLQPVTAVNEISQAVDALGAVDAIYVPTDNTVVSGLAVLIQSAEQKHIPVIGSEADSVAAGAAATVGIDYEKLGFQTGMMAIRILQSGQDPSTMAVQYPHDTAYIVNPKAAERQGVTIPEELLKEAEIVG